MLFYIYSFETRTGPTDRLGPGTGPGLSKNPSESWPDKTRSTQVNPPTFLFLYSSGCGSKQKRNHLETEEKGYKRQHHKQMPPEFWDQEKIHCKLDYSNSFNLPRQEDSPPSTARYLQSVLPYLNKNLAKVFKYSPKSSSRNFSYMIKSFKYAIYFQLQP